MHGDITLAGVTLTLEEWETLDRESRDLLLELAVGGLDASDDERAERAVQMPAMIDLLARSGEAEGRRLRRG
jgi:hypothetical protein